VVAATPASSALLGACFLGASTAVHVVAFVTFGHAPPWLPAETPHLDDIVVSEIVPSVDEPAPEPAHVPNRSVFVRPPTHRHPYPVALPLAAAADVEPAPPARFTMVIGGASVTGGGHVSAQGAPAATPGDDEAPLSERDVSSPAQTLGVIAPIYPPVARAQGVEGDVVLAIVVTTAGTVADVMVERRAGFGFDEAVLAAVRAARFMAARRDGRAVAVRMRLAYSFRLE